ncbi:hypothetical protein [uncultured Methylobacterium sp.]|uniref:hypothetical protein n=1 Tax=uncultured Methylobacterium sp. TaxID=157278 RepID=UPI0035C9C261
MFAFGISRGSVAWSKPDVAHARPKTLKKGRLSCINRASVEINGVLADLDRFNRSAVILAIDFSVADNHRAAAPSGPHASVRNR